MKIATVDFEKVLNKYKPYKDSMELLDKYQNDFSLKMNKIREEMERIVNSSRSLLLDDKTKSENVQRMRELQSKAAESESEFRVSFAESQREEMDNNFKQIIDIVNDLVKKSEFDMVLNKNSVIFQKSEFEITDEIIGSISKIGMLSD